MNRVRNRFLALGIALLGATAARATPSFPDVIRTDLNLSVAPSCAVCHQGTPAVGTVVTPFGASLRARGLVFYDEASLHKALASLGADKVDSDGDGTPDTEELMAGRNPNLSDAPSADGGTPAAVFPPEPTYGCGAAPGASLGALLVGAWGLRGRRRRA